jgi:hypothetical protein
MGAVNPTWRRPSGLRFVSCNISRVAFSVVPPAVLVLAHRLLQRRSLGAAVIQPVEKQLKRAVRLVAEVDLRPEQHHFAFT